MNIKDIQTEKQLYDHLLRQMNSHNYSFFLKLLEDNDVAISFKTFLGDVSISQISKNCIEYESVN